MKLTRDQVFRLLKLLLEFLIAALAAIAVGTGAGCTVKWSSNSAEVRPLGYWEYRTHAQKPAGQAATTDPTNSPGVR